MTKLNLAPRKTLLSISAIAVIIALGSAAKADLLKGSVNASGQGGAGNTTLNRGDIGRAGADPFGSNNSQTGGAEQELTPVSFSVPGVGHGAAPPKSNPFDLNAQGDGQVGDFNGQQGIPTEGQMPQQPQQQGRQQQPGFNPNDPDSSPELQLQWDEWHKRVAEAVYQRYTTLANAAFYHSRPLAAVAAYTVTRDGRIVNARLTQRNMNPIYNAIVLTAINSLNGNSQILQFPQGSRRQTVDQAGTFTQNYENMNGYKFIKNDRETIKH